MKQNAVACGKCVRECQKQVIHVHECANYIVVQCSITKRMAKEARNRSVRPAVSAAVSVEDMYGRCHQSDGSLCGH